MTVIEFERERKNSERESELVHRCLWMDGQIFRGERENKGKGAV